MARFIKMAIYGEPGVGKSTFAAKAPRPYFITTDGNYEYLEDFCGSKPEDHKQCFTWAEMKEAFHQNFDNYDTIVVDLVEDSYMWAENEFCKDNHLMHISDLGYGKGYGILGNDFFIEYQKLLALPKNIILILHGVTEVYKDRRGVEYTKYGPSKLIREKIITQIEGRVRFFLRAYAEATEAPDGGLITKRWLSLSPDGNTEYGITRGLSGNIPRAIPLDWDAFVAVVGNDEPVVTPVKTAEPAEKKKTRKPRAKKEESSVDEDSDIEEIKAKLRSVLSENEIVEKPKTEKIEQLEIEEPAKEEVATPAVEDAQPVEKPSATISTADKMAAIKAKMAALKANRN